MEKVLLLDFLDIQLSSALSFSVFFFFHYGFCKSRRHYFQNMIAWCQSNFKLHLEIMYKKGIYSVMIMSCLESLTSGNTIFKSPRCSINQIYKLILDVLCIKMYLGQSPHIFFSWSSSSWVLHHHSSPRLSSSCVSRTLSSGLEIINTFLVTNYRYVCMPAGK